MRYVYNTLEEYIKKMYESIDIHLPRQLDMETIANRLGLVLEFLPVGSMVINRIIVIDERLSTNQQWQDFCHELSHALLHAGNQICVPLPFRLYQEWKATNFMYHACIPTFMLLEMDLPAEEQEAVYMIRTKFNVGHELAKKRLSQYLANFQLYRSVP